MDLELDLNLLKALRYSIPIRIFQLLFRGRIFNSVTEKVAKFGPFRANFLKKIPNFGLQHQVALSFFYLPKKIKFKCSTRLWKIKKSKVNFVIELFIFSAKQQTFIMQSELDWNCHSSRKMPDWNGFKILFSGEDLEWNSNPKFSELTQV